MIQTEPTSRAFTRPVARSKVRSCLRRLTATVATSAALTTAAGLGLGILPAHADPFTGTPGNDRLVGTNGPDGLSGEGGNDVLEGRGGDDLLIGGRGDDVLKGGKGVDAMDAGPGNDTVVDHTRMSRTDFEQGGSQVSGGSGNDTITAHGQIEAGRGDDVVTGSGNVDAGPGHDRVDVVGPAFVTTGKGSTLVTSHTRAAVRVRADGRGDVIRLGASRDDVEVAWPATARISTGAGNDRVDVDVRSAIGTVRTGAGNDTVYVVARAGKDRKVRISCGKGKDRVLLEKADTLRLRQIGRSCERVLVHGGWDADGTTLPHRRLR